MNKSKLILATVLFLCPFFLQISWIIIANKHSDLSFLEIRDIYTDFIGDWVVEYKHTTAFLSFVSYVVAFSLFMNEIKNAISLVSKGLISILIATSLLGALLSVWTIL